MTKKRLQNARVYDVEESSFETASEQGVFDSSSAETASEIDVVYCGEYVEIEPEVPEASSVPLEAPAIQKKPKPAAKSGHKKIAAPARKPTASAKKRKTSAQNRLHSVRKKPAHKRS
jgi:hypothetical protein